MTRPETPEMVRLTLLTDDYTPVSTAPLQVPRHLAEVLRSAVEEHAFRGRPLFGDQLYTESNGDGIQAMIRTTAQGPSLLLAGPPSRQPGLLTFIEVDPLGVLNALNAGTGLLMTDLPPLRYGPDAPRAPDEPREGLLDMMEHSVETGTFKAGAFLGVDDAQNDEVLLAVMLESQGPAFSGMVKVPLDPGRQQTLLGLDGALIANATDRWPALILQGGRPFAPLTVFHPHGVQLSSPLRAPQAVASTGPFRGYAALDADFVDVAREVARRFQAAGRTGPLPLQKEGSRWVPVDSEAPSSLN